MTDLVTNIIVVLCGVIIILGCLWFVGAYL